MPDGVSTPVDAWKQLRFHEREYFLNFGIKGAFNFHYVKDEFYNVLVDDVVSTSIVIGRVFLDRDELSVGPCPHSINHNGLEVGKQSTGDKLVGFCLAEEFLNESFPPASVFSNAIYPSS